MSATGLTIKCADFETFSEVMRTQIRSQLPENFRRFLATLLEAGFSKDQVIDLANQAASSLGPSIPEAPAIAIAVKAYLAGA